MALTHVIHIADLHIRTGNNTHARVDEYKHVFDNFYNDVKVLPYVAAGNALLVIAGDVFHSKCRTEAASTKVFFEWINQLLDIMPIIVICGNHDYKQDDPHNTDSIEMMVAPYQKGTRRYDITYLKDTGLYDNTFGNIVFGVVSVKDTLREHNTAGIVDDLPPYPEPNSQQCEDNKVKIALFHGSITQSDLQSGTSVHGG